MNSRLFPAFILPLALLATGPKFETLEERVVILRDPWGIPNVFASTDAGAFYGMGYAVAEDRGFQMHYDLRTIQGRLAEVIGNVRSLARNETAVDHDRKMRTFGFHRTAQRVVRQLNPETLELLQSYCDGVNDFFRDSANNPHPLFAKTGLLPEPWTPADCLAVWWHLGQYFGTDGTRDLIAGRNAARGPQPPPDLTRMPPDDAPAVVKRSDVRAEWIEEVKRFASEHGMALADEVDSLGPRFSHAWVVGRDKTSTGSAVLVSDPQTPVRNPALFCEVHVQGKSFNARGICVPGSPILLVGFSQYVAWGVTALGADQADLFLLDTDSNQPNQYRFDGEWRAMQLRQEVIKVRGGEPVVHEVRETHLGPVATAFCFASPRDGEVAVKRVPLCETRQDTITAALAMLRARTVAEFDAALTDWRYPSINVVFGDRQGSIGYRAAAAIPVRSRLDVSRGRTAQPGHRSKQDWQGFVPHHLLPGVIDPAAGYLYSGNHKPIESWYPIPLGAMTGGGGDTVRSWRLRERLQSLPRFRPEDVRAIHFDSVNAARRDLVKLGLHLRNELQHEFSKEAKFALLELESWYRAGASSSLSEAGAALALELNTFFRLTSTELATVYGGGESGLAYFLKTVCDRVNAKPQADLNARERAFIEQSLATAWSNCQRKYGAEPSTWNAQARKALQAQKLGYFETLSRFPTLDADLAVSMPPLNVTDAGCIGCQTAQCYTQWVPLHDRDLAESLLPIGQSDRPQHRYRTSTMELWAAGQLHPAPLSRAKVEALGCSSSEVTIRKRSK